VKDEWKLMHLEQEEPQIGVSDGVRIEKYWKHFMTVKGPDGGPKYPKVLGVVAYVTL